MAAQVATYRAAVVDLTRDSKLAVEARQLLLRMDAMSIESQQLAASEAKFRDLTQLSAQVLASIALKRTASTTTIVSFNAARIPEDFNNFTAAGRSLTQYTALAFALAVPLFMLWTLVSSIRTPMERTAKWLWCLFIIVGVGKFSIDWVTGVWTFTPIYLLLFGAGAVRGLGGYGPWIISVAIPAGAIAFQIWRARQTTRADIAPLPIGE